MLKLGKLIYQEPTIEEKIKHCEEEMASLYPEVKRNEKPHEYYVDLTDKLRKLKQELIRIHISESEKPVVYKKEIK